MSDYFDGFKLGFMSGVCYSNKVHGVTSALMRWIDDGPPEDWRVHIKSYVDAWLGSAPEMYRLGDPKFVVHDVQLWLNFDYYEHTEIREYLLELLPAEWKKRAEQSESNTFGGEK